jgi:SAM-dependent methyltransferase
MSPEELREAAKEFYWYHSIDLGQGVRTEGDYAMNEYLPHYHFPADMRGLKVLDVGRASGYFSFEFEQRGARVVATEISSFLDWDFVGGELERARRAAEIGDAAAFTRRHITGAFHFSHAVRRSNVELVTSSIYEIAPETVGADFDIVFAGSITSHLRDPILGMERLRTVTAPNGVCIVSAPYIGLDEALPLAAMVGTADISRRSWWVLNKRCLTEMLTAAGFNCVEIVDSFELKLCRPDVQARIFPHIVAHARIDGQGASIQNMS